MKLNNSVENHWNEIRLNLNRRLEAKEGKMADETKCPFCKAPRRSDGEFWKDEFECDTEEENVYVMVNEETTRHSTYKRSKYCYERQIDALQDQKGAWKTLALVYEKVFQPTETMKQQGHIGEAVKHLKDLGEWPE